MIHEFFMYRCLQQASYGAGYVAPNPMVGAVLVFNGEIIGEGYHKKYGEAHAEVNCISSVKEEDRELISQSILYVSLEPCNHFGKTPPCSDLIIKSGIKKVVVGCRDPFEQVNARLNDPVGQGKGIEKLKTAGVEVMEGILEDECKELNKRFFTFHTKHRPYIILKWAESADNKIAASPPPEEVISEDSAYSRLFISNEHTNRLVHKWRSEEASILVGTNTALADNPELTTRLWPGPSPTRLVVDLNLRLPADLKIFNSAQRTIIFNKIKQEENGNLFYYKLKEHEGLVYQIANALYELKIQSVLVEGGARLLQSFIDADLWDEARVIKNGKFKIKNGLAAPVLSLSVNKNQMSLLDDKIIFYQKI